MNMRIEYRGRIIEVSPRQYIRHDPVTNIASYHTAKNSHRITVDCLVKYDKVKKTEIRRLIENIKRDIDTEEHFKKKFEQRG